MRRLLAVWMALLFALCAPSVQAQAPDTRTEAPGAQAEALDADVAAMSPVLEALACASLMLERDGDAGDPAFFWTALGLLAERTCADDPLCALVDGELRVPRQKMQELASAAFSAYSDLLPLPAGDFFVRYDEAWDAYFVAPVDADGVAAEPVIGRVQPNGTIDAELAFRAGGTSYALRAVLTGNRYLDGIADPAYPYAVAMAELQPDVEQRRTREAVVGGTAQTVDEARFVSTCGYALWFDDSRLTRATGEDGDRFRCIDPETGAPGAELTIAPADAARETELLGRAMDAAQTGEAVLDSGLRCRWTETSAGGRTVRRYLIQGCGLSLEATLTQPAGAEGADLLVDALLSMEPA